MKVGDRVIVSSIYLRRPTSDTGPGTVEKVIPGQPGRDPHAYAVRLSEGKLVVRFADELDIVAPPAEKQGE